MTDSTKPDCIPLNLDEKVYGVYREEELVKLYKNITQARSYVTYKKDTTYCTDEFVIVDTKWGPREQYKTKNYKWKIVMFIPKTVIE